MIVKYRFNIKEIFEISKENIAYSLTVVFIAVILKVTNFYHDWGVPGTVTGVLGTALSILLGFSNSQAYDRWWEARKVWGSIVNDSRSFAKQILTFADTKSQDVEIIKLQHQILNRHFAYINALRMQLRDEKKTPQWHLVLTSFISEEEFNLVTIKNNTATQLMLAQSASINELYKKGAINEYMHLQMDLLLSNFYTYQGQAERIKNTPFLPTYHFFSKVFLYFFITLLPFSLLSEVDIVTTTWMLLPVTVIIGWVFHMIYLNGSVYAYPFSNNRFDTPMTSICNTIEIDLKEMMGEKHIPEKIKVINGILM
jgi:putative membrane protein